MSITKLLILTAAVYILPTVPGALSSDVNMSSQRELEETTPTKSPAPNTKSQESTTTSPAPTTSHAPSGSPVSMPATVSPTHNPTRIPTHSPTNAPTTPPSSKPSTTSPASDKPTSLKPTRSPTTYKVPTNAPTTPPSSKPSTSSPTSDKPTSLKPTRSPTTNKPTRSEPTVSPTTTKPTSSKPTSSKSTTSPTTIEPLSYKPTTTLTTTKNPISSSITASPTGASQTGQPTINSVISLTAQPIATPTPAEAMPPNLNLTDSPDVESSTKTNAPTLSPVASSLTELCLTGPVQTTGLKMILTGIGGIPNETRWESTTSGYYAKVYEQTYVPFTYNHKIEVTISQVLRIGTGRSRELTPATLRLDRTRALQSDGVEVTYKQDMWYCSDDPNIDPTTAFNPLLPLSTETLRSGYIGELKTLEGFEDLTAVSEIFFSSDGNGVRDGGGDDEPKRLATGAIVGIAVGAAAALIILVLGLVHIARNKKNDDGADNSNNQSPPLMEVLPNGQDLTSASGTDPSIPQAQDD